MYTVTVEHEEGPRKAAEIAGKSRGRPSYSSGPHTRSAPIRANVGHIRNRLLHRCFDLLQSVADPAGSEIRN
jgi:hypothetical protein